MESEDHRKAEHYKKVMAEVEGAVEAERLRKEAEGALELAPVMDADARLAALERMIADPPEALDADALIEMVADANEDVRVRRAAIRVLEASQFFDPNRQAWRPAYLGALRESAKDEDADLRLQALGRLAIEKDSYAQGLLTEGLQDPGAALVPPEDALRYLAADEKSGVHALAREALENPPSEAARLAAVEVLATSPEAEGMLTKILSDTKERLETRRAAAASLRSAAPEAFMEAASGVAANADDDDDLRATCVTGITQSMAGPAKGPSDALEGLAGAAPSPVEDSLRKLADELDKAGGSDMLMSAVRRLKAKLGD